jgi:hypothetical protein
VPTAIKSAKVITPSAGADWLMAAIAASDEGLVVSMTIKQ